MAMAMGGPGSGPSADMNVTPVIDVLLVLLIIFMVITPLTPKGLDALVPQPPKDQSKQPPSTNGRPTSVGMTLNSSLVVGVKKRILRLASRKSVATSVL